MAPAAGAAVDEDRDEMMRECLIFSPSIWGDRFSSTIFIDNQALDKYSKEVEVLKAKVRCMVTDRNTAVEEKLALINALERLGISHLFRNEIDEELKEIFISSTQIVTEKKPDLSTIALYFRLLRQHGFRISSQIFEGFRDKEGFKETHSTDVKGLLNMYEAAHTMIHGEDILEEALAFSTTRLKLLIPNMPPSLARRVSHALEQPLHRAIPRVEARLFISVYEEDESKNDSVLRLAKLDFTLLQILHRKELSEIISWWKELGLISKLPYARDRIVECYFWSLGLYFEPQFSLGRVMLTKIIALNSIIDDTYDSYGTLDELKVFTQAVRRWDISEVDGLPEYMKPIYKTLLQLYVSFEEELNLLGRSFAVSYAKQTMKENIESYYTEAKWIMKGEIPSYEEYLENGLISVPCFLLTTTSLLGMESATKQAFEWLKTNPKIMISTATLGRLLDDLGGYEMEKERGQITSGIDCYMKQYKVTKEEAMNKLKAIVENARKDINEGCLEPKAALADVLKTNLNLVRGIDVVYKHDQDGYTNPEKMYPHIMALLVDTFQL